MNDHDTNTKKYMTADEAAALLSQTMKDLMERKIPLRQALAISRVALALTKAIEVADLDERVKFIEQTLRKRK